MPDTALLQEDIGVKRERRRVESLRINEADIADRIQRFYDTGSSNRSDEIDRRLQRYAKFRMWTEPTDDPWPDAFNVAIPDLATHSLRIQDSLHNSVMTLRPCVSAVANAVSADQDKGKLIDGLIDYQVFTENPGEKLIGDMVDAFVNDNSLTVYIPWVKEKRGVVEIKVFDPIPQEEVPVTYFKNLLLIEYPKGDLYKKDKDGWEWEVDFGDDQDSEIVSFYTRKNQDVEMVVTKQAIVFDGPRPTVIDWQDIMYPVDCDSLQPRGPSNPLGASHVLLLSYPEVDEIRRLQKSGFYNMLSDEDLEKIEAVSGEPRISAQNQEEERQRDAFAGKNSTPSGDKPKSHKGITRVMCFDRYDIDGDGLDEDVIWWMILETKTVLRACYLSEMFPADPPRRPFAESSFIPVRGRRDGISLLELLEGLHDFMKQVTDQTANGGTLANTPFGFYTPSSSIKPETVRFKPGMLYPFGDQVSFPNMQGASQAFGFNMLSMFGGMEDKLAMQSDLQFGRVPTGQASALRTTGAQQTLLAQGEARPERILRRFFICLTEVWAQIHELNQRFLPRNKKFRITGYVQPGQDPYMEIAEKKEIAGRYQFTFKANVLNSSKQALQGALQQIIQLYMTPIAIQSGAVGGEEIHRLLHDFAQAMGQDPEQKGYIRPLPPGQSGPPISAEMAITAISNLQYPPGHPLEGAQIHYQKLMEFAHSDDFHDFLPETVKLFGQYLNQVGQMVRMELQQQQLIMAAQQNSAQGQQQGGKPAAPANTQTQQVSNNELIDETLPGAKGGND